MTLPEGVVEVRAVMNEPVPVVLSDTEIEAWLSLAAVDVCLKTLGHCAVEPIYLPANDLSGELEQFADSALSGTPRVVEDQSVYFKVYPTKAAGGAPVAPSAWKSWDDTTLSGTPRRIGFRHGSGLFWMMGYPTAAALNNPTADADQDLLYDVPAGTVAGTPWAFCLETGGVAYYFKAYELTGYPAADGLLMHPVPTGLVKTKALQRLGDGGSILGLVQTRPAQFGHLNQDADIDPLYYNDFAQTLFLHPGGGARGLAVYLAGAFYTVDFTELADELQPPCLVYAIMLAHYKIGKYATGAALYRQYLSMVLDLREALYPLAMDGLEAVRLADAMEKSRPAARTQPQPRRKPRRRR
jgi:hypothetical protein